MVMETLLVMAIWIVGAYLVYGVTYLTTRSSHHSSVIGLGFQILAALLYVALMAYSTVGFW